MKRGEQTPIDSAILPESEGLIERLISTLRAENETWNNLAQHNREASDHLEAENERLTLELAASLACNAANNELFMSENERLRAENGLLMAENRTADAENERLLPSQQELIRCQAAYLKLDKKVERLREALETVIKVGDSNAVDVARAALQEKK
jgi:hypothetical protein